VNGQAILISCLLAIPAQCQRLAIKTYTTADGLSHNSIHRILRDSRGFIWFATAEGLSRFDGYGFTNYGTAQGLPNPHVYSILETRAGVLWIGTGGGLCRFAARRPNGPSSPIFSTYPLIPGSRPEVRALAEGSDGTLWVGTSAGLWRSAGQPSNGSFEKVHLESDQMSDLSVRALVEDSFQTLWIGIGTGLYRRRHDGRIERYRSTVTQGPIWVKALRDGG
jgi:ligand-binding sensor domain-containing protein